jgi:hypothetical protein
VGLAAGVAVRGVMAYEFEKTCLGERIRSGQERKHGAADCRFNISLS